jgi:serine phosphatase RsbU (regulator of sigma subunit)/CheY-like chemotaxis protein
MNQKGLKIVIVEDDNSVSSLLTEYVTSWGLELLNVAMDGQNALEAIELTQPNVLFIDAEIGGAIGAKELGETIRKTSDALIFYVLDPSNNVLIEELSTIHPNGFIHLPLEPTVLKNTIEAAWNTFLVWNTKVQKIHGKLEMSSMQIQELTETNAHLITATFRERALKQELEATKILIEAQAKKIQDSINYAKSIQNSILPKELVLKDLFPDSFLLFRPKDIVSGDFPFIYAKDDLVYVAAVDCTGHGVPGALLSLIGSLLIQEIVHYGNPTPSVLLDRLHEAVVKTLRQGQEGGENERDGMDVGMCLFNRVTGEFQFSGAHRPLYIIRKNAQAEEELEELKGDKYPIGGVQYRGRESFINVTTQLEKGDRVFVCSDGYPDQFGGPDATDLKKIGPKRIRQILVENKNAKMNDVQAVLSNFFESWQGGHKQMDDVLFIGIEY